MSKKTNVFKTQKDLNILKAALTVFASYGLQGASLEKIAEVAKVSKSNLLYYFESKEVLYIAVLSSVLEEWLSPLDYFCEKSNPKQVLEQYIEMKYKMSKENPEASRLYALEMIQGAPYLTDVLKKHLKPRLKQKILTVNKWIEQGRLKPISPLHLILHIWAITQHYADFSFQIKVISGQTLTNKAFKQSAIETTKKVLVEGLIL